MDYRDNYYYKNEPMKPKYRKIILWFLLIFVAIVVTIVTLIYSNFTAIPSSSQKINETLSTKKIAKEDIKLYFYQQGCEDCKSVRWKVLAQENLNGNPQVKYLNINTQDPKNDKYVKQYDVQETPTIVHLQQGKVIEKGSVNEK